MRRPLCQAIDCAFFLSVMPDVNAFLDMLHFCGKVSMGTISGTSAVSVDNQSVVHYSFTDQIIDLCGNVGQYFRFYMMKENAIEIKRETNTFEVREFALKAAYIVMM